MFLFLPAKTLADSDTAEEEIIRVRLSVGNIGKLSVAVEGQYRCGEASFVGGTLTITASNGSVRVRHSEHGTLATGESVRIEREEETVWAAFLMLDNARYGSCRYLGDLELSTDGDDRLVVTNHVDMRAYLYGVVGGELRNTHPTEALKAQAIAAKCFALTCLDPNAAYDLDDTPTDQVYKGYHPAHENVLAAVNAVADQALYYEGYIVRCYYCTQNGGQTVTPLMRWGNRSEQDAVFRMAYDPYDLMGTEDAVLLPIQRDATALPEALYAFLLRLAAEQNPGITAIDSIVSLVGLHDPSDPDGSYDAPAELASHSWIDATLSCHTADGTEATVACGFPMEQIFTEGILTAYDTNTHYLRPEEDGNWTLISSKAIGHRVGMSHAGLLARAEAGHSYDEILRWYYPGATLLRDGEPLAETQQPAPSETPQPTPQPTATPEPALIPYEKEPSIWARIFG